ncbi:MAG: DNA primase [Solirubrobacteraceae bacterium]
MTRYADDSRDRVFEAVDMVRLMSDRGIDLRRAGVNSYFGNCPFHDERTGSFHVSPDERLYHCFGCQASGDAFKFVMETEGIDFVGALESLASRFGVALQTRDENPEAAARRERFTRLTGLLDRTATFYARYLWESAEAAEARDYLRGRGLAEEVLREFRVGFSPGGGWDRIIVISRKAGFSEQELLDVGLAVRSRRQPGTVYDQFRGQIMFPAADERGRIRGFGARRLRDDPTPDGRPRPKYVNTSDGTLYHKREVLFGVHLARGPAAKAGRMILAEGYTDVLALHQAGIRNAVGIMGTSLTNEQVETLAKIAGTGVLCLDADNAGRQAMLKAAQAARGRLELRVVGLPEGSDPADLVAAEGPEGVRARIERSVPFVQFEVDRILDDGDTASAEGRDRALAELAPVLSALGPSALRDELMRRVSGSLELTPARLASALEQAGVRQPGSLGTGVGGAGGVAGRPGANGDPGSILNGSGPPGAGHPMDGAPKGEQVFLALCLALPEEGERALSASDIDELLTSERLRRAAAHLRGRTRTPTIGLPDDDQQLAAVVAELVRRAGEMAGRADRRPPSPERLEHARLVLELERVDRARIRARAQGSPATSLARERERVMAELHAVVARLEQAV